MARRKISAGTANVTIPIFVNDTTSSTGAGLAITSASSGLVCEYRRQGVATWTAITLSAGTLGTPSGSSTAGTLVADGSLVGAYEFAAPDNPFAAGARWCQIRLYGVTNMLPVLLEFELDVVNYQLADFGLNAATVPASPTSGTWGSAMGYADSRVGRRGTAQAGSTSTTIVLDSGASAVDNSFKDHFIKIIGGTGSGQFATIVSYVGATKTATVSRPTGAWTTTPDATSIFEIIPIPQVDLMAVQNFNNTGQSTNVPIAAPANFAALGITAGGHITIVDTITNAVVLPANPPTGFIISASFAAGATIPRVTLADTLTTYTSNTPQTGDSFARIGVAGAGLTNVTVTTVADKTGYALSSSGVSAIVNDTTDTLGVDIVQILARIGVPSSGSLAGDTAAVKTDTNTISGRITATRAGYLDNLSGGLGTLQTGDVFAYLSFMAPSHVFTTAALVNGPAGGGGGGSGPSFDGGSVSASPSPTVNGFSATGAALHSPSGGYAGMKLFFQTGTNQSTWRVIQGHTVGGGIHAFVFAVPFSATPGNGDTFVIG